MRRTASWGDEAAFWTQLNADFAPKLEVWNATFPLLHHLFRQALKAIARANFEQAGGGRMLSGPCAGRYRPAPALPPQGPDHTPIQG